jgi:hypothetical protein
VKWVTREDAKVDRIACPWLIRRFIDAHAEFLFVPSSEVIDVATREGAIPFDVKGAEIGHVDGRCSFESIVLKYNLSGDPALMALAKIVHAADVTPDLHTSPEGPGLKAIAHGFSLLYGLDDGKKIERESPLYDALYAWCQKQVSAAVTSC